MITPTALILAALVANGLPAIWREGPAQVPNTVDVFFHADADGDLKRAVLLCRVDIVGSRGWDTFGAVDMAVTITAGKAAPVTIRGPEDRSSAVISVPGVDLAAKQHFKIVIEDRDVTENEFIARGDASYTGKLPLRIDLADVQVECRAVDRATAETRAKPALAKAAHKMTAVERATPDLNRDDLGAPESERWEVTTQIDTAAAWLGDDDASVRALATQLQTALDDFDKRARAALKSALAALPEPGTQIIPLANLDMEARIVPGPSLIVEVHVPKTAKEPVKLRDEQVAAVMILLDPNAREMRRYVQAVPGRASEAQGVLIAPGETRRIRMRSVGGGALPPLARVDGVLARVR